MQVFRTPDDRQAWEMLRQFDQPIRTAFDDSDPVTAGAELEHTINQFMAANLL